MKDKEFREAVARLLDNLEYDLALKLDVADRSAEYKIGVLKVMINDAKDTIKYFRESESVTRETSNDFDVSPLTLI